MTISEALIKRVNQFESVKRPIFYWFFFKDPKDETIGESRNLEYG